MPFNLYIEPVVLDPVEDRVIALGTPDRNTLLDAFADNVSVTDVKSLVDALPDVVEYYYALLKQAEQRAILYTRNEVDGQPSVPTNVAELVALVQPEFSTFWNVGEMTAIFNKMILYSRLDGGGHTGNWTWWEANVTA